MTNDDVLWDDEPQAVPTLPKPVPARSGAWSEDPNIVEPKKPPANDDWSDSESPVRNETEAILKAASTVDINTAAVPDTIETANDQILADLAVLDHPDPPSRLQKRIVPVTNPPSGDPDDLSLHEGIFAQKVPVRVIQHPRGGRRIIVGTGGGIDSFVAEVWVEKHPSANAYRPSPGRKIVMVGYNPGLRIRCVVIGKGTAYLKVTEQGLKLVTKSVYDQR